MIRRTATRLADGRELIYFDDTEPYSSGAATRRLDDPRPLGDRFGADFQGPQMRRDPLTGDWIPMASHRMNRTFMPAADSCPLCPAQPDADYSDGEIPATEYDVVVFENRFAALMTGPAVKATCGSDTSETSAASAGATTSTAAAASGTAATNTPNHAGAPSCLDNEPLFATAPARGRCEVVCFSSQHTASFADLSPTRVTSVIAAWADRTRALNNLEGIKQVFCFENRGKEIGVTLPHPHGQIYAFPYVPARTAAFLQRSQEHFATTGGKLINDVITAEIRSGRRIVSESEYWIAFVPAAARWPVEVHLAAKRDVPDFPALTAPECTDLAHTYLELLHRLDRFFVSAGDYVPLPYIAGWHQAVTARTGERERWFGRLHLQLFSVLRAPGKLKYLAGVESGMASWISDTTPEQIADRLKEIA